MAYKQDIYENCGGMCECGCGREGTEYHHTRFGIHKDDHYLALISQHPCHYLIHHSKDTEERHKLKELFEERGEENYRRFFE